MRLGDIIGPELVIQFKEKQKEHHQAVALSMVREKEAKYLKLNRPW